MDARGCDVFLFGRTRWFEKIIFRTLARGYDYFFWRGRPRDASVAGVRTVGAFITIFIISFLRLHHFNLIRIICTYRGFKGVVHL